MTTQSENSTEPWVLRLYIAGQSLKCITAIHNLRAIVDQYLPKGAKIEIIDVAENMDLAEEDQILAIPTLLRKSPKPARTVIGMLTDPQRVLIGLDIPANPNLPS